MSESKDYTAKMKELLSKAASTAVEKAKNIDTDQVKAAGKALANVASDGAKDLVEKAKNLDADDVAKAKDTVIEKAVYTYGVIRNLDSEQVKSAARSASKKVQQFDPEEDLKFDTNAVLRKVLKLSTNVIDREAFLREELADQLSADQLDRFVADASVASELPADVLDKTADTAINEEVTKASSLSAVAGSMWATIPADLVQYFGFVLRIAQKLAYLYGWPAFDLTKDPVDDRVIDQLMVFVGIMYDVPGAENADVEEAARLVGSKMTKLTLAKGVGAPIPLAGSVISAALTYATLRPASLRLKTHFAAQL